MPKIYTAADHQKAFEIWYESRNWTAAARVLKCNWETIKRWSDLSFKCSFSCPWHGYDDLMEQRDRAHQARIKLIEQGNYDPVAHDTAIRDAVAGPTQGGELQVTDKSVSAALDFVRTDIERIQHWELLWSKVFFDATGQVTSWREFKAGREADLEMKERLRGALRTGLHATSLEQAVKMLKIIQDQIDKLQGASHREHTTRSDSDGKQMTLDEMRKMRRLVKNTPPMKLHTMMSVVKAEEDPADGAVG